ncbi:MAG: GNAT family N-acetyltransferase, partial [Candidatus Sumerlaeaceae bacterium]|nr:GNAT family N-acetyltransferase [Candidatus Sumerlaeaceae bacterium]
LADSERVLSAIQIIPYEVVVGGKTLAMGGIGGVATWADQQGYGFAGRLMSASVPRMRELGFAVSFLYPFSFRYYGKFGWELAGRRVVYTNIRPTDLPRRKEPPRVKAAVSEDSWQLAQRGYEIGFSLYNCLVRRGEREWEQQRRKVREGRYQAYVIFNDTGDVRGYFSCEDIPISPGPYETVVRDVVCADSAAYEELFAFLATLPTNVAKITIGHAEWPWLWRYFREPFVETRVDPYFQGRVVDVEKACRERGYPEEVHVEVEFGIRDPLAMWNNGSWRLRVTGGMGTVERTDADPALVLTIQQFSAIFLGFLDPAELISTGVLPPSMAAAAQKLRQVFCDRPTNLLDFF